ncbi:hypothetical protein FSP39_000336 [Pinctada imbricata]|uniref:Reverse transcriptase domain-containing protein n=1 Tax=Pinctada imbricata TaxID=66713 RepID=A0AA88Y161_PINIB|nr:hypothetical protein FSP39_000336 [Pinctada imbricata]
MHNEIRKNIRKRNRQHKIAKISKTPEDWTRFKELRNKVIADIKTAKINHFKKIASNLQNGNISPKNWWKLTKQFFKEQNTSEIPIIIDNNEHYSSPSEKADKLNKYFNDQSNVDDSQASLPSFEEPNSSIEEIMITESDVDDTLSILNPTKASGSDVINPRLLKEGSSVLAPHLAKLFNSSLSMSYFPSNWKKANVIPVYKEGDKTNVTNYRPISLISCLGKVFEKCVFKHLYNFINDKKLITPVQSGFTPNDSSVYQLTDLYNTFVKAIDDGKEIRAVFCDVSKAFDRVWHRGLLYKLRRMGVKGGLLGWFGSYLWGRTQRVVIDGSSSSYLEIKAGVPQGSILGPLLFVIYINDIVENIGSHIRLFADDTSLYIIVDDPEVAAGLMDSDLHKIHEWAKQWLVTFNPQKSEELVISKKSIPLDHPRLSMDNVEIKRVDEHKHLGLIFNTTCTWRNHFQEITGKAWKRIHLLQTLKFKLDRRTLEIMYNSFIRPLLEYADVIWDNCYDFEVEALEKIQIEAGRVVTGATKSCSASKILNDLKWETLKTRRYKHRLINFYKMIHNLTPQYLSNLVPQRVHQVSNRTLRNNDDFSIPYARTNLYSKSFLPQTVRDWNNLPDQLKLAPSLNSFKTLLNNDKRKPPKYYFFGNRQSQILHSRLRLHCSSLNADLFDNHISESNLCTCGSPETAEHFLLTCNKYSEIRNRTIDTIPLSYSIQILLEGNNLLSDSLNEEIFSKVHEFIIKSRRFN